MSYFLLSLKKKYVLLCLVSKLDWLSNMICSTNTVLERTRHVKYFFMTLLNVNFSGNFHNEQHFVVVCTILVEISVLKSIWLVNIDHFQCHMRPKTCLRQKKLFICQLSTALQVVIFCTPPTCVDLNLIKCHQFKNLSTLVTSF